MINILDISFAHLVLFLIATFSLTLVICMIYRHKTQIIYKKRNFILNSAGN